MLRFFFLLFETSSRPVLVAFFGLFLPCVDGRGRDPCHILSVDGCMPNDRFPFSSPNGNKRLCFSDRTRYPVSVGCQSKDPKPILLTTFTQSYSGGEISGREICTTKHLGLVCKFGISLDPSPSSLIFSPIDAREHPWPLWQCSEAIHPCLLPIPTDAGYEGKLVPASWCQPTTFTPSLAAQFLIIAHSTGVVA